MIALGQFLPLAMGSSVAFHLAVLAPEATATSPPEACAVLRLSVSNSSRSHWLSTMMEGIEKILLFNGPAG